MSSQSPTTLSRRAYTIAEFCHVFGIGRTKTDELMRAGVLATRNVGRRVLITADSAEAWFDSLPADVRAGA